MFLNPQSQNDTLPCLLVQSLGAFSHTPFTEAAALGRSCLRSGSLPHGQAPGPVCTINPALRCPGGRPPRGSHCISLYAFFCFTGSSSFLSPGIPFLSCNLIYTFKGVILTWISSCLEQEAFEVPLAHHILGPSGIVHSRKQPLRRVGCHLMAVTPVLVVFPEMVSFSSQIITDIFKFHYFG